MYRHCLRILAAGALIVCFWSVLRFRSLTIFDWSASLVVLASLPYRGRNNDLPLPSFELPVRGVWLFTLGGFVSTFSTSNISDHAQKVSTLLIAFCMMLGFVYVLSQKKIFSVTEALSFLAISGAVSSSVAILQGQFGLLTFLVPGTPHGIQPWIRLTGLTDHPIEAGTTSAFSVLIALGLAVQSRRWLFYFVPVVVGIYSMKYTASVTAVLALVIGICTLCIYSRAYSLLIVCIVAGIVVALAFSTGTAGTLLEDRLEHLKRDPGNYQSLRSREVQWEKTFAQIDGRTIIAGNGYATADLPDQGDIHGGLLAVLFHFGMLGLMGQCLLIWFFVCKLRGNAPRGFRGMLIGCIVVFAATYLTGPTFARRSVWIPMFVMGAYLPEYASRSGRVRFPSRPKNVLFPFDNSRKLEVSNEIRQ